MTDTVQLTSDEISSCEILSGEDTAEPSILIWPERPGFAVLLAFVVAIVYIVVQAVAVFGLLFVEWVRHPGMSIDAWTAQAVTNGTVLAVATCAACVVTVPLIFGFVLLLAHGQNRLDAVREFLLLRWPGAKSVAMWLVAVIAYIFAADWISSLWRHEVASEFMLETYRSAGSVALFWIALLVAAPVNEELLFRGLLFRGLAGTWLGWIGAAILTSAVWALVHVQYDWGVMLVIFGGGLLLAAGRQFTGSLVTCILMHAAWNFIATIETAWAVSQGS